MRKIRRFVQVGPYECEVVKLPRVVDHQGRPVAYHVRLDKGRVEIDRREPDPAAVLNEAVAVAQAALAAEFPPLVTRRVPVVGSVA